MGIWEPWIPPELANAHLSGLNFFFFFLTCTKKITGLSGFDTPYEENYEKMLWLLPLKASPYVTISFPCYIPVGKMCDSCEMHTEFVFSYAPCIHSSSAQIHYLKQNSFTYSPLLKFTLHRKDWEVSSDFSL